MTSLSIRWKLGVVVVVGFLVVGLGISLSVSDAFSKSIEQSALQSIQNAAQAFANVENDDTAKLSATAEALLSNPELKAAFIARDRERLTALATPLFLRLKAQYRITHFYFHTLEPERKCFLRVHKPEEFGDVVERATFAAAMSNKAVGAGKELGKTAFALRVVHPYYEAGKLVGYVELGEEIDHFLGHMKVQTGDEFGLLLAKKNLDRTGWAEMRAARGQRDDWDDLPNLVVAEATSAEAKLLGYAGDLSDLPDQGRLLDETERGGSTLIHGAFPVRDVTGRTVGAMLVEHDITALRQAGREARWRTVGLITVACLGLLALLILVISAQVTGPLARLTAAAHRVASEGDLTQTIEVKSRDEIGQLASAFSQMVIQLREVHTAIEAAVQKLAGAASEIYAASQEQEAAAQTQSSGAEEVNRTMLSLLESATHIADSANGVFSNAERSKETAASTARKISELSAQTNGMVEILEVIREIADRTDLLALNASLEGTRAGEAGRGFSLVANEMRRLSERVTVSVSDVKGLVTDIRASGASTVMVTDEARKLAEGTASSAKQITFVTQQQRTATELVSKSMKDVAGVLVQTVAANRQTKRAAEDLKAQAERLSSLVSRFKVEAKQA